MISRKTPVVVEQNFNCSVEKIWNAITQVDLMRQWYFNNIPDFKPLVGFETQFNVQSGSHFFLHQWKITKVVPIKLIEYEWTYDGIIGNATVAFEILEDINQRVLMVTASGLDTFQSDIQEFTRESCLGGWNYFIKERLTEFLTKN